MLVVRHVDTFGAPRIVPTAPSGISDHSDLYLYKYHMQHKREHT